MRFVIPSLVVSLAAALPFSANAVLLNVSYSGVIDTVYADGEGYSPGQAISGSLQVDTALALVDLSSDPTIGWWFTNDPSFVTGFVSGLLNGTDQVFIRDQPGADIWYAVDEEMATVSSGNTTSNTVNHLVLEASGPSDFVTGTSISQEISFSGVGIGLLMHNTDVFIDGIYSAELSHQSEARFFLTNLRVTSSVPEPGTILLLSAGLVGVGLVRRRRSRTVSP